MDDLPARNKEDAQKRAIALLKNLGIGVRIGGICHSTNQTNKSSFAFWPWKKIREVYYDGTRVGVLFWENDGNRVIPLTTAENTYLVYSYLVELYDNYCKQVK